MIPTPPPTDPIGPDRLDSFETELLGLLQAEVTRRAATQSWATQPGTTRSRATLAAVTLAGAPQEPTAGAAPEAPRAAACASPSSRGRRRPAGSRRLLLPAAAAAAGVVGLAGALSLAASPPAYALSTAPNGDVTVRILRLADTAALRAALAEHGIRAEIDYLPRGQVCAPGRAHEVRGPNGVSHFSAGSDGASLTISANQWDPTWTLLMSVSGDLWESGVSVAVADGPVGRCEPVPLGSLVGGTGDLGDLVQPGEPPRSSVAAS